MIARAEDASKINRIKERFDLAAVDTASIVNEAEKSKETKTAPAEPEVTTPEKAGKDKLLDELMGKPIQKEENAPNPSVAKTEKSPLSEPTSEQRGNTAEGITKRADKPSVRGELRQIRESRKAQEKEKEKNPAPEQSGRSENAKPSTRKTEHKQPPKRRKTKKSKGAR